MITSIITAINSAIDNASPSENLLVYGLAKLMLKDNQPHPVTDINNIQIAINDKYNGLIYHRLISSGTVEDKDEFTFGSKSAKETTIKVRTIVINKKALTEDFKYDVANRIPEKLVLAGYKYIDIGGTITIDENDDNVYEQEFGGGDYEKRREPWIISALEYDIKFLSC